MLELAILIVCVFIFAIYPICACCCDRGMFRHRYRVYHVSSRTNHVQHSSTEVTLRPTEVYVLVHNPPDENGDSFSLAKKINDSTK